MPEQNRDSVAEVRIRCDHALENPKADRPSFGEFVRDCYEWWRDGCMNCAACATIQSFEVGDSDHDRFRWRMALLYDLVDGRHGDGVQLPRQQLSLFANRRQI